MVDFHCLTFILISFIVDACYTAIIPPAQYVCFNLRRIIFAAYLTSWTTHRVVRWWQSDIYTIYIHMTVQ